MRTAVGSDGENVVWPVSAVGQPQQVIELRSLGDQILGNLRSLVPHELPVDGVPELLVAVQGREQAGAPDGAGGGVGILAEVALIKLRHNGAVRRADGDGVDGFVQIDEAEEEPSLLAEHRIDLGHEADDVLDGIVPLALPREALQVLHAEEHVRLLEQSLEGGVEAVAREEGEEAAATEPRHAWVLQGTPHGGGLALALGLAGAAPGAGELHSFS